MGYGKESMSKAQKNNTRAIFDAAKTVDEHAWNVKNMATDPAMAQNRSEAILQKRDVIIERLSEEQYDDDLYDYWDREEYRVIPHNEEVVSNTTWLNQVHIPKKTEIDNEMVSARNLVGASAISQSQRTKRGKKFREKAERQAKAIREMNLLEQGRNIALVSMLNSNLPKEAQAYDAGQVDGYLSDLDHLNGEEEMVHDMALYAQWRDYSETKEGKKTPACKFFKHLPKEKNKITYQHRFMNLLDSELHKEEYIKILLELDELDLDVFNYTNDEEFVKNYSYRMAALKAFSHAEAMRVKIKDDERLKSAYEALIKPIYNKLSIKSSIINAIIEDYEMRIKMIRSPYYALLASKDIDSMSIDDLEDRIANAVEAEDWVVADYLQSMVDKRKNDKQILRTFGSFSKGVKASDIEKREMKVENRLTTQVAKNEKEEERREKAGKENQPESYEEKMLRAQNDPKYMKKLLKEEQAELRREEKENRKREEEQRKKDEKLRKSEEKQRKAEEEKEKKKEAERIAERQLKEYDDAKVSMEKYICNLGDYYTLIKKNNKKIKESDAVAMALEMRANGHISSFQRDKNLREIYPLRQIRNIDSDYTKYLVGCNETERNAIKWLNSNLSFSGAKHKGDLNEAVPALDEKLSAYQDKLILLLRQTDRIDEAVKNAANPGVNFDVLYGDYTGNKNFSKSELNLQKSIQEGIKIYRDRNLNSKEHKAICNDIKKAAIDICRELMRAYTTDLGMTEEAAELKLGKALAIGRVKGRKEYDEDIASMSGTVDARKMPERFPEEYAAKSYQTLFGKKADKSVSQGYEGRRQKAQERKGIMDGYYDKLEKNVAAYSAISGVGELRDEIECIPFLDKAECRKFLKAAVATNNKTYSKMNKKDAAAVRDGLKKIFDHLLEIDLDILNFNSDDEMFENYEELMKYAKLGFVLMKLIDRYYGAGGILNAEERNQLFTRCHTLCGLKDCISTRSKLTINPDWVLLGGDRISKLKEDKLKEIFDKQETVRASKASTLVTLEKERTDLEGTIDDLIKSKSSDEFYLKGDNYKIYATVKKMKFSEAKKMFEDRIRDADESIKKIETRLGENALRLEVARKEMADAVRYKALAYNVLEIKKMESKTAKGEIYHIVPGVSLSRAMIENKKGYETEVNSTVWNGVEKGYFSNLEAFNNLWKVEDSDYGAVEKLCHLGKNEIIFSELAAGNKTVELKKLKRTEENMSASFKGLVMQFKSLQIAAGSDGKLELKRAFKQFQPLIMSRTRSGSELLGKTIAQYRTILHLAQGLDEAFGKDEKLKNEVLSKQSAEDVALYNDILEFSSRLLPMIGDMEYMMKDKTLSAKKSGRIKAAIESYLQTLYLEEKKKDYIGTDKWTMPSKAGNYKEFYDAVGNAGAMETLMTNYNRQREAE